MALRRRGRPAHPDLLTPAEWHVLDLVRHGMSRRQIAQARGTTLGAAKYHLANIGDKLGVRGVQRLRQFPGYPSTGARAAHPKEGRMTDTSDAALGPIGQVSLNIRDVARAERFYGETLGLPHHFTFGDLAFFDAGGVRLYLHRKDEADWQPSSVIYFLCDDIGAWHSALADRGVHFSGAPHLIYTDDATGAEEWMAFFDDGEGNMLALMSRVGGPPGSA
jgi:DNA-binding CsgD family transcriptional regulator/predicted enzyme related to lactoylglutathione lyase